MSSFKYIAFDIDGTLLSGGTASKLALQEAMQEVFAVAKLSPQASFSGRTDFGIVADILKSHSLESSKENINRLIQKYGNLIEHHLKKHPAQAIPGAHSFIKRAQEHRQRLSLGILTGNCQQGGLAKLKSAGFNFKLDFSVYGEKSQNRNDLAAELLEKFKTPKDIIIIGDTIHDIRCAKSIGAKSIAVLTGSHSKEKLASESPDLLIEDLESITIDEVFNI